MRSRIVALFISVLLFLSCLFLTGLPERIEALTEQDVEETPVQKVETVICSFENISYGQHEKQTFDLNLPVDNREEIGLLLYIHGGGWVAGDKSAAKKTYSVHKASKDYATASVNYRFVDGENIDIYDIITDITQALYSIKSMAAGYNVNISKVILSGHSAGGHLSLLYAYRYKHRSPIEIAGVFAKSSVPDLAVDSFYSKNKLGDENYMCDLMSKVCGEDITPKNRKKDRAALLDLFSPITYVDEDTVPTLILHGDNDKVAPYSAAVALCEKLTEYKVNHELITFKNAGHGLKTPAKTKKYAQDVMSACIYEWFNLTEN